MLVIDSIVISSNVREVVRLEEGGEKGKMREDSRAWI